MHTQNYKGKKQAARQNIGWLRNQQSFNLVPTHKGYWNFCIPEILWGKYRT